MKFQRYILVGLLLSILLTSGFSIGTSKTWQVFLPPNKEYGVVTYEILNSTSPTKINFSYTYAGSAFPSGVATVTGKVCLYKYSDSPTFWNLINKNEIACSSNALYSCGTSSLCQHIIEIPNPPKAENYMLVFSVNGNSAFSLNTSRLFTIIRTIDSQNKTHIYSTEKSDELWSYIPQIILINVNLAKWAFVALITTFIWLIVILFFSILKRLINLMIISLRRKKQ